MIQFNLLPDIKLTYIKAERAKRLATTISVLVIAGSLVIMGLLLAAVGWQKKSLSDLNKDIASNKSKMEGQANLNKILTVQKQIATLPSLEQQNPLTSRLFGYISQLTPNEASISDMTLDFTKDTVDVSGQADSVDTIDKFVDTLKFTTYSTSANSQNLPAFSNVVLTSYTVVGSGKSGPSYEITANFDPAIFNAANNLNKLTVPSIISTRSETDKPNDLFVQQPTPSGGQKTTNSSNSR